MAGQWRKGVRICMIAQVWIVRWCTGAPRAMQDVIAGQCCGVGMRGPGSKPGGMAQSGIREKGSEV